MGDPLDTMSDDGDVALNRRDCPHCSLWFRLDEAIPAGQQTVRCPNCGWEIEAS